MSINLYILFYLLTIIVMLDLINEIVNKNYLQKKVIVKCKQVVFCNLTKEDLSSIFNFLKEKKLIKEWPAWNECIISMEWGLTWYWSNWYITTWDFELIKEHLDNDIKNPFEEE